MMTAAQRATTSLAYRVCGLQIVSSVELGAGAPYSTGQAVAPDVQISAQAVPDTLPNADHRGPNWETSASQILLRIPSLARLLMNEGREISYDLEPGADASALPLFLTGSALGALLHQRGEYVLHASAVKVDGGAAVFCGQSGAGKSSLVAALCAAGFPLVSDDVCRIHFGHRGPIVIPDGRRLKLWPDTITHLGLQALRGGQIRPGIEKFWVDPPTLAAPEPLSLRALYFLRPGAAAPTLSRQPLVHAVEHLRAFAYRPRLVRALSQEALWLNRSALLAAGSPIIRFERPWSLDQLPASLAALEDHWSRL